MKVLIVDDNVDAADTFRVLVERLGGHEALASYSAESALETLTNFRADVIFLDISMPKVDGYELCRRIRLLPWASHTPIYAVTGWTNINRRVAQVGFTGCIVKPFEWSDVERLLVNPPPLQTSSDSSGLRG